MIYHFTRANHGGWHVYDTYGSLIYDVTHVHLKMGWFENAGCEVHLGQGGVSQSALFYLGFNIYARILHPP